MDLTTFIGIIFGMVLVLFGIKVENLGNFWDPESVLIVMGGTLAALLASYPARILKQLPKQLKILLKNPYNPMEFIDQLYELAIIARKNGLLALEEKAGAMEDPFFREGLMLIVDSTTPQQVNEILNNTMDHIEERHSEIIEFYEKGASYAPAFGMVGTLIGLVNMLMSMNMEDGADGISTNMGIALITTFYGSVLANLFFMPIAKKLQVRSDEELLCRKIIIEGILAIQAGENPSFLKEKLITYLPQYERSGKKKKGKGDSSDDDE
ncbi:motility protein A [Anaerotignum sp. MB30-C6]|uniref:motility protein A n=1 Tax=Anaerotignum sp. MB30-C6 TaxID=3070814 RepID=UPI0027DBFBAD|nr:motility protein A [Anaerotignum sp. MB30-C6]WMI80979.1 motility protein A [Anaerotignum sp. MB30-C6]